MCFAAIEWIEDVAAVSMRWHDALPVTSSGPMGDLRAGSTMDGPGHSQPTND
jgi:hypothetical protein